MYSHILVPVSYEEGRDASRSVAVAKLLASPGAKVTLLHVTDEVPSYAVTYMPTGYRQELNRAIESDLAALGEGLENGQVVVIEGHSGRTILEWAGNNAVDCIVIASHRPGMQDLFLGSTAARVVRHAPCAVHVVR